MAKNDTNVHGMNVSGIDTTPDQFGHFFRDSWTGYIGGLAVTQNSTPNMTVLVAPGTALLTKNTTSAVVAEVKANTSVTISTASTSNPRIDAIIIYEDTSVTITPYIVDGVGGRFKVASVVGTPAASPAAPTDSAIQSEIGAGKPWARLANVTVATSTTTIINSNISDQRSLRTPTNLADNSVSTPKLVDGSVSTAKIADGAVTGAKMSGTYKVSRQNNSTNTTVATSRIETGWKSGPGTGTANVVIPVTYGTAFTSLPVVTATFGGDKVTASTTYGDGGANIHSGWCMATNITTTGFNIVLKADTGTWNVGHIVWAQWTAIGE